MRRVLSWFIAAGLTLACSATRPERTQPAAAGAEAALRVYVAPFPAAAGRLAFRIASIAAVGRDGAEFPLQLELDTLDPRSVDRERRIASGTLPPGAYAGLAIRAVEATLSGPGDSAMLAVGEEPAHAVLAFNLRPSDAAVVVLELSYAEAVDRRFAFRPAFVARLPSRLAPGLIALATARGDRAVTLFDRVTGQVGAVVPTRGAPAGLAVDGPRRRAYVALPEADAVLVLDALNATVIDRLHLSAGDRPLRVALADAGRMLLVVNEGSETLSLVDLPTLYERVRVRVGNGPTDVVVDATGTRAVVLNSLSDTLSVVGLRAGAVIATVATEAGPFRARLDRSGRRLWIAHRTSSYLAALDVASLVVERRLYVGPGATALALEPRTDRIWLARRGAAAIEIYDPTSLLPSDSFAVGEEVGELTMDPEAGTVCLVLPVARQLRLARLVGKHEVARVDIGGAPFEVAYLQES